MSTNSLQDHDRQIAEQDSLQKTSIEAALFVARLRNSVWIFGIPSWLFGIADRGLATFADGYVSPIEIFQLVAVSLFFLSWLVMKPEAVEHAETRMPRYQPNDCRKEARPNPTQIRLEELCRHHMIRQEYILPFPALCQIYHLLNLKHLESVHNFSLNNLRILSVSELQPTDAGGIIRFQTMLDSPFNVLRIWRQPIVEVDLILHSPHTVELSIPVYEGRRIVIMFHVFPTAETEHQLVIDIYSDLMWFKPVLQTILHAAASMTLFEDLSYLRSLTNRNLPQLLTKGKISNHQTMQLLKQYVSLYGLGMVTQKSV